MGFLKKNADQVEAPHGDSAHQGTGSTSTAAGPSSTAMKGNQKVTFMACFLGLVASIGGFMFGYVRSVAATNSTHQPTHIHRFPL